MIAQNHAKGACEISWIADSGAGRDLASLKALQEQRVPSQSANYLIAAREGLNQEMAMSVVTHPS